MALAFSVMVFPVEVAVSQVVAVVTAIAGVAPGLPGKPELVSLNTTCCGPELVPLLYVKVVKAGLANSTWLPVDVTSSVTATCVIPLGVVTVMVAV